jgi:hypothetical protein
LNGKEDESGEMREKIGGCDAKKEDKDKRQKINQMEELDRRGRSWIFENTLEFIRKSENTGCDRRFRRIFII